MFILDMIRADKYNAQADKTNIKALNKLGDAQREQQKEEEKTRLALEKLANRKKGIMQTSINNFIQLYEKIMLIEFKESDEIDKIRANSFSPAVIDEMRSMVTVSGFILNSSQTVSTFLIGFLKFGGLTGGVSNVIAKEAELYADAARMRKKAIDVSVSQSETIKVVLDGIFQRAERMSMLLAKFNILFRKSIEVTSEIIEHNGKNGANYNRQDRDCIKNCLNFADAIKKVLATPLMDENGAITEQSMKAIETGEKYLSQIQEIINS